LRPLKLKGASAINITTIGLDLAKEIFQVHAADAQGKAVLRKQLCRSEMAKFFAKEGLINFWS